MVGERPEVMIVPTVWPSEVAEKRFGDTSCANCPSADRSSPTDIAGGIWELLPDTAKCLTKVDQLRRLVTEDAGVVYEADCATGVPRFRRVCNGWRVR
jgi:hypothetical protein